MSDTDPIEQQPADATSSTPANDDSATAIAQAEERRKERVRFRNEAQLMMEEDKRRIAAPRLRAKARAEYAASVAIESLGVHDALPDSPEFNHLRTSREGIHKSVVSTFEAMGRVFDSEHLDSTQGIAQVAKIGRETLGKYIGQIGDLRISVQRLQGEVEERLQKAMTPPAHLARLVEQARDALRSMSAKDRDTLIANARSEEGIILAYAVGAAPSFLSGVQAGQREEKRSMLLGLRDPKLLSLEPGVAKAYAALDKMEAGIAKLIGSVADFDAAQALSDLRKA